MKSSEILRECARKFEKGDACYGLCYTTKVVSGYSDAEFGSSYEARAKGDRDRAKGDRDRANGDRDRAMSYVKQFAPRSARAYTYWFGGPSGLTWGPENQQDLRILAACFAAAVAESEGD